MRDTDTRAPAGPTVHTVGHSNHPIAHFVALLKAAGVEILVDVRSHPGSRFHPQFNKAALARSLEESGISYRWLGEALGGKPKDAALLDAAGRPDYAKMAATPEFASGIGEVIRLASASGVAIMCAEADPARCHRSLLVGPALMVCGARIRHIRGDGRIVDHPVSQMPPQSDLFGG